jgi:hypothetical protein
MRDAQFFVGILTSSFSESMIRKKKKQKTQEVAESANFSTATVKLYIGKSPFNLIVLDVHRGNTEVSTLELSSLGDFNRYITIHHFCRRYPALVFRLFRSCITGFFEKLARKLGLPQGAMLPWQEAPWPSWHMVAVIHYETWLGNIDTMGT